MEWTHLVIITLIYVHEPKSLTGAIECEIPDYAYSEKRRKNQYGDEIIQINRFPEENDKNPFCSTKLLSINTRKKFGPLSINDKENYGKFVDNQSQDLRFVSSKNFFLNRFVDCSTNNKSSFRAILKRYDQNHHPLSCIPLTMEEIQDKQNLKNNQQRNYKNNLDQNYKENEIFNIDDQSRKINPQYYNGLFDHTNKINYMTQPTYNAKNYPESIVNPLNNLMFNVTSEQVISNHPSEIISAKYRSRRKRTAGEKLGKDDGSREKFKKLTMQINSTDKPHSLSNREAQINSIGEEDEEYMRNWLDLEKEYRNHVNYKNFINQRSKSMKKENQHIIGRKISKSSPIQSGRFELGELEKPLRSWKNTYGYFVNEDTRETGRKKRDIKCCLKMNNGICSISPTNFEKLKEINLKIENKKRKGCPIKETFIEMTLKKDPIINGKDVIGEFVKKPKGEVDDEMEPFQVKSRNFHQDPVEMIYDYDRLTGPNRDEEKMRNLNKTLNSNINKESIMKYRSQSNKDNLTLISQSQKPLEVQKEEKLQKQNNMTLINDREKGRTGNKGNNFYDSLTAQRDNISKSETIKKVDINNKESIRLKGKAKGKTVLPVLPIIEPVTKSNSDLTSDRGNLPESFRIETNDFQEKLLNIIERIKFREENSRMFEPMSCNIQDFINIINRENYNKFDHSLSSVNQPIISQNKSATNEKIKIKCKIKSLLDSLSRFNNHQNDFWNMTNDERGESNYTGKNNLLWNAEQTLYNNSEINNILYKLQTNQYGEDQKEIPEADSIQNDHHLKRKKGQRIYPSRRGNNNMDWTKWPKIINNLNDVSNKLTLPILIDMFSYLTLDKNDSALKNDQCKQHNDWDEVQKNRRIDEHGHNDIRKKRSSENIRNYNLEQGIKADILDTVNVKRDRKSKKIRRNKVMQGEVHRYSKKRNKFKNKSQNSSERPKSNLKIVHPFFYSDDIIAITLIPSTKIKQNNESKITAEQRLSDAANTIRIIPERQETQGLRPINQEISRMKDDPFYVLKEKFKYDITTQVNYNSKQLTQSYDEKVTYCIKSSDIINSIDNSTNEVNWDDSTQTATLTETNEETMTQKSMFTIPALYSLSKDSVSALIIDDAIKIKDLDDKQTEPKVYHENNHSKILGAQVEGILKNITSQGNKISSLNKIEKNKSNREELQIVRDLNLTISTMAGVYKNQKLNSSYNSMVSEIVDQTSHKGQYNLINELYTSTRSALISNKELVTSNFTKVTQNNVLTSLVSPTTEFESSTRPFIFEQKLKTETENLSNVKDNLFTTIRSIMKNQEKTTISFKMKTENENKNSHVTSNLNIVNKNTENHSTKGKNTTEFKIINPDVFLEKQVKTSTSPLQIDLKEGVTIRSEMILILTESNKGKNDSVLEFSTDMHHINKTAKENELPKQEKLNIVTDKVNLSQLQKDEREKYITEKEEPATAEETETETEQSYSSDEILSDIESKENDQDDQIDEQDAESETEGPEQDIDFDNLDINDELEKDEDEEGETEEVTGWPILLSWQKTTKAPQRFAPRKKIDNTNNFMELTANPNRDQFNTTKTIINKKVNSDVQANKEAQIEAPLIYSPDPTIKSESHELWSERYNLNFDRNRFNDSLCWVFNDRKHIANNKSNREDKETSDVIILDNESSDPEEWVMHEDNTLKIDPWGNIQYSVNENSKNINLVNPKMSAGFIRSNIKMGPEKNNSKDKLKQQKLNLIGKKSQNLFVKLNREPNFEKDKNKIGRSGNIKNAKHVCSSRNKYPEYNKLQRSNIPFIVSTLRDKDKMAFLRSKIKYAKLIKPYKKTKENKKGRENILEAQKNQIKAENDIDDEITRDVPPTLNSRKFSCNKKRPNQNKFDDELGTLTTLRNDGFSIKSQKHRKPVKINFEASLKNMVSLLTTMKYKNVESGKTTPAKISPKESNWNKIKKQKNNALSKMKLNLKKLNINANKCDFMQSSTENAYDMSKDTDKVSESKLTISENVESETPKNKEMSKSFLQQKIDQKAEEAAAYENQYKMRVSEAEEKRIKTILDGIISRYKANASDEVEVEDLRKKKYKKYQGSQGITEISLVGENYNRKNPRQHLKHSSKHNITLIPKGKKRKSSGEIVGKYSQDSSLTIHDMNIMANNDESFNNNVEMLFSDNDLDNDIIYINNTEQPKKKKGHNRKKKMHNKIELKREKRDASTTYKMHENVGDKTAYKNNQSPENLNFFKTKICNECNDKNLRTSKDCGNSSDLHMNSEEKLSQQENTKLISKKVRNRYPSKDLHKIICYFNNDGSIDSVCKAVKINLNPNVNDDELTTETNIQYNAKKKTGSGVNKLDRLILFLNNEQKSRLKTRLDKELISRQKIRKKLTKKKGSEYPSKKIIKNETNKLKKLDERLNELTGVLEEVCKDKVNKQVENKMSKKKQAVRKKVVSTIGHDLIGLLKGHYQSGQEKGKKKEPKMFRDQKTLINFIKEYSKDGSDKKFLNNLINEIENLREKEKMKPVSVTEIHGDNRLNNLYVLLQSGSTKKKTPIVTINLAETQAITEYPTQNLYNNEKEILIEQETEELTTNNEKVKEAVKDKPEIEDSSVKQEWEDLIQIEDVNKTEQQEDVKKNDDEEEKELIIDDKDCNCLDSPRGEETEKYLENVTFKESESNINSYKGHEIITQANDIIQDDPIIGQDKIKYANLNNGIKLRVNIGESISDRNELVFSNETCSHQDKLLKDSGRSMTIKNTHSGSDYRKTGSNVKNTVLLPVKFNTNEFIKLLNNTSLQNPSQHGSSASDISETIPTSGPNGIDHMNDNYFNNSLLDRKDELNANDFKNRFYLTFDSSSPNMIKIKNISVIPLADIAAYMSKSTGTADLKTIKNLVTNSLHKYGLPSRSKIGSITPTRTRSKIKGQIRNLEKVVFLLKKPLNFNLTHQVPRVVISLSELRHRGRSKPKLQHRKHYLVQVDPIFMMSKTPIQHIDYTSQISKVVRKVILYGFKTPKIAKWLNVQQIG